MSRSNLRAIKLWDFSGRHFGKIAGRCYKKIKGACLPVIFNPKKGPVIWPARVSRGGLRAAEGTVVIMNFINNFKGDGKKSTCEKQGVYI